MHSFQRFILASITISVFTCNAAYAQDINLLPKYGSLQKNDAQQAADKKFISSVDTYYNGDRKKAAAEISMRGWQLLRQGNIDDAMRRFNQAWLLDNANGNALWGMYGYSGVFRGQYIIY